MSELGLFGVELDYVEVFECVGEADFLVGELGGGAC